MATAAAAAWYSAVEIFFSGTTERMEAVLISIVKIECEKTSPM